MKKTIVLVGEIPFTSKNMKSQVLRLLILVTLLSGAHNAFAEVSIENALEDQKRICTYKDGIYEVNTIESNESFLLSAGERNEIIQQVVKKSGSLYFAVLFFPYIGNTQEGIRYSYQPNISVYKVTCRNQQSKILMSAGYGWSDTILNGAILNAEIDMIDDKYLVVKAYNATSKTNIHLFYDLV